MEKKEALVRRRFELLLGISFLHSFTVVYIDRIVIGDGLGTKAIIFEPTATKQNDTQIEKTLINQGNNPPRRTGNKSTMFSWTVHVECTSSMILVNSDILKLVELIACLLL